MSTHKLAALACAAALALNCAASSILASTPTASDATATAPAPPSAVPANGATTSVEGRATSPEVAPVASSDGTNKKGGNAFIRALAAPFRALARLFSGGSKKDSRQPDTAKVKPETKTTAAAASAPSAAKQPDRERKGNASSAASATVAAQTPRAPVNSPEAVTPTTLPPLGTPSASNAPTSQTTAATVTAPPAQSSSTARSDAATSTPFMPLVVGVPHDPISQGRALIAEGLFESAISELSVAAATGVNLLEANNLLGLAYDHRGQHKEAQEFYQRALSIAPNDAHVINNLGYSLYLDDRPKEALTKLKLAARLDPSSREIFNNLGFASGRLGKFDDAFKNFARAGGELYARYQTGALLEAAGRDRDAIKHYEAARRLDPASTDVLRRLIELYNRTGQRDKAEAAGRLLDQPKSKAVGSTTG
ncbi:MAG: tetratricopeptide repeat protein [Pyrinomonadaceae bacterium]